MVQITKALDILDLLSYLGLNSKRFIFLFLGSSPELFRFDAPISVSFLWKLLAFYGSQKFKEVIKLYVFTVDSRGSELLVYISSLFPSQSKLNHFLRTKSLFKSQKQFEIASFYEGNTDESSCEYSEYSVIPRVPR